MGKEQTYEPMNIAPGLELDGEIESRMCVIDVSTNTVVAIFLRGTRYGDVVKALEKTPNLRPGLVKVQTSYTLLELATVYKDETS